MAWATKKQFAILMSSEKGKDLAEKLPDIDQSMFQEEFAKLLGSENGKEQKQEDANVDPLSDDELEKLYSRTGGDDNVMISYLRKIDLKEEISNGDLQGIVESFMDRKHGSI